MSSLRKSVVITFAAMFVFAAPLDQAHGQCCGVFGGLNAASGVTLLSQQGQALALNLKLNVPPPQSVALFESLFSSRTDAVFISNVEIVIKVR